MRPQTSQSAGLSTAYCTEEARGLPARGKQQAHQSTTRARMSSAMNTENTKPKRVLART